MKMIRFGLGCIALTGVLLVALGVVASTEALCWLGVPVIVLAVLVGIKTYSRAELITDLRHECGLLVLTVVLAMGAFSPRPAFAYSVTGAAPWCSFDGFLMTCFYYSYQSCLDATKGTNRACVPNPDARD